MASRNPQKRSNALSPEQRKRRIQQIVITVISIILILSWIAALLINI